MATTQEIRIAVESGGPFTLADIYERLGNIELYDAPTGKPIGDKLAEYDVLSAYQHGDTIFFAVRGPSGQYDVCGPDNGSLNRDVISDYANLGQWVEENYPF